MLFHGVDEYGEPMNPEDLGHRRGRINWANADWDQNFWDDDEEDDAEWPQPADWILDDDDIGFDLFL